MSGKASRTGSTHSTRSCQSDKSDKQTTKSPAKEQGNEQGRGESVAIGGVSCQNDQVVTAKLTNFYLFNAENVTPSVKDRKLHPVAILNSTRLEDWVGLSHWTIRRFS